MGGIVNKYDVNKLGFKTLQKFASNVLRYKNNDGVACAPKCFSDIFIKH